MRISVDRDDFQGVNSFHEKLEVTNFGEYEDYEMILETPEPEEPETEDPETPEPEAPDTPDEDTEDDDSDRNSGRGNSRSEWTEKPNGSWKQDGRGWWFAKLDGSYPADGWFECSWNGKKGWYHFNAEGYMETGWFTDKDGHTYFLHDQNDAKIGAMYTGWRWIGDNCYYFTKDSAEGQPAGSMVKNGKTPDGYTVNAQGSGRLTESFRSILKSRQVQDFPKSGSGNDRKWHRKRNRAAGSKVQIHLLPGGSFPIFPAVLKQFCPS